MIAHHYTFSVHLIEFLVLSYSLGQVYLDQNESNTSFVETVQYFRVTEVTNYLTYYTYIRRCIHRYIRKYICRRFITFLSALPQSFKKLYLQTFIFYFYDKLLLFREQDEYIEKQFIQCLTHQNPFNASKYFLPLQKRELNFSLSNCGISKNV